VFFVELRALENIVNSLFCGAAKGGGGKFECDGTRAPCRHREMMGFAGRLRHAAKVGAVPRGGRERSPKQGPGFRALHNFFCYSLLGLSRLAGLVQSASPFFSSFVWIEQMNVNNFIFDSINDLTHTVANTGANARSKPVTGIKRRRQV
jgi:hypothetical protein